MTTKNPIKIDSADYLEQLCDMLMKKAPRWFDALDGVSKEVFVNKVCSNVFRDSSGQTCNVIGYPRKRDGKLMVPVSDMDAGRTFLLPLSEVKKLLRASKGRETTEQDYMWNHVTNSSYEVEAEDISITLGILRGED